MTSPAAGSSNDCRSDGISSPTGSIGSPRVILQNRPTHLKSFTLVCGTALLMFATHSLAFLLGHVVHGDASVAPNGYITGERDRERPDLAPARDGPISISNAEAKRSDLASKKRNAFGSFQGDDFSNNVNGADGSEDKDDFSEGTVTWESGLDVTISDRDARNEDSPRTAMAGSKQHDRTESMRGSKYPDVTDCPGPNGPQPYVLMTLGRSGSGSTWQIIGNLTGYETPSVELTGNSGRNSRLFFQKYRETNGRWILSYLCHIQRKFPESGVVGFKWKPFATIFEKPAQDALKIAAALSIPSIKIVRSRRNLLDVLISRRKHSGGKNTHLQAHCLKGDEQCLKEARAVGTGLELPTEDLLKELKSLKKREDETDKMLKKLGLPHVHVSYERLYIEKDPEEWMRIFRFLGVGPKEGLEWTDVEAAMQHVSTSNSFHNATLKNYEEVRDQLSNSEFAGLLHR